MINLLSQQKMPYIPPTKENIEKVMALMERDLDRKCGVRRKPKGPGYLSHAAQKKAKEHAMYMRGIFFVHMTIYNSLTSYMLSDMQERLAKWKRWGAEDSEWREHYRAMEKYLLDAEDYMRKNQAQDRWGLYRELADVAYERTLHRRREVLNKMNEVLRSLGVRHSLTAASVAAASMALHYSSAFFESYNRDLRKRFGFDFSEYHKLDTRKLEPHMDALSISIPGTKTIREDTFLKDRGCLEAIDKLFNYAGSTEFMQRCCEEAIRRCPECLSTDEYKYYFDENGNMRNLDDGD